MRLDHVASVIEKANHHIVCRYPDREPSGNNLSKAGWSWGIVSAIDCEGRTIWIVDAHRGDGKRFVVRADEKLTAFVELKSAAEPFSASSVL